MDIAGFGRARHLQERARERRPRRPAEVDLRAQTVRAALSPAHGPQLGAARLPLARAVHHRRRPAADDAERARAAVRAARHALPPAGLLSGGAHRADVPGHRRAQHRRLRPDLVRLALPADRLHGDALPQARVPHRRLGGAAAPPRPRSVDARQDAGGAGSSTPSSSRLSFVIANVFLAWIIGAPALLGIVTDSPARHIVGLVAIVIFSFVFYMVFARFREQACVLACPYGRMLSALTDARTITITYDWRRGEPRNRLVAGRARGGRRLHRLPPVRHGVSDRNRHPRRHPAGVRQLHRLHRCVQWRHGARGPPAGAHPPHVTPRDRDCRRGRSRIRLGGRATALVRSRRGWRRR